MDPIQDESWIVRMGIYWILAIGALLGVVLVLILVLIFGWDWTPLLALAIIVGCGLASAVLSLAWIVVSTKVSDGERQFPVPVPLLEFLADTEAVIAPNLAPRNSMLLAAWLRDFQASHGEDSVWVLPLPDGPYTDSVVFLVSELSPHELEALRGFDVDSIADIPASAQQSILPHIPPGKKLIEAFWD